MKNVRNILIFLVLAGLFGLSRAHAQSSNVGIGTTAPDASALLDLTSISRGLLIPRMTEAQKVAISSPATGLMIYQTDNATISPYAGQTPTFWYFNGTTWVPFLSAGWLVLGNSGTSANTNFIGTLDSVDWVIRTNNAERLRVYAGGNVALTNADNKAEEFRFYQPSGTGSLYSGFKASPRTTNSVTYTWPSADGNGTNYILCTDGFGNLSWRGFGSAGGGGLDTFWSRGTGRFSLIGHGAGCTASGDYSITDGFDNWASGTASVVWGENNIGSGYGSVISGGASDTASGNYSTIGAGSNNSSTGSYSSVVAGQYNSACGPYAVVVGGTSNTACGSYATVLGGTNNNVSGNYSLAFGIGALVSTDNTVVYYASGNTPAKVGVGTQTPAEALDIVGNLRFSGALMPNGLAGTPGYILQSAGASTPPVWASAGSLGAWSTWGNSGTTPPFNYIGTSDAQAFVFKTYATERMRILSTGQVAINTTSTTHQLHSLYSGTTDETAAVFGQATGATSSQVVGVWGSASGTGTGSIGVLGTGNGITSAGSTNVALQVNDGEVTMGRTTETSSSYSVVESAATGTAYSAQGPSGVIELTLGSGGNLSTVAPNSGVFQNLGKITVSNRYCSASSIVIVNVVSKSDDGVAPDCKLAEYFADVSNRTSGGFDVQIGMIPTTTSASNYTTSDKIRLSYLIVNPGR
ncbi:MAG: hypothetical protein Q8922_03525 [Bacteroidota bacterium]|nr:hypothetical protein [Bacteroidota bacterium]MDP4233362.1 hypothetical protein [Bacteroidota bacterium]MDP4242228.1 hypothetical protein [Bacteroidota bacterium]MDP4286984.1 hypothetical protein [Bacteroidota bacterium]